MVVGCCLVHSFEEVARKDPHGTALLHASPMPLYHDHDHDHGHNHDHNHNHDHDPDPDLDPDQVHGEDDGEGARGRCPFSLREGDAVFTYSQMAAAVDSLCRQIIPFLNRSANPAASLGFSSSSSEVVATFEKAWGCEKIGIWLNHSVEYIVAILAVRKCEASFIPLDPLWPMQRILGVIDDARPCLLLTKQDIVDSCKSKLNDIDVDLCAYKASFLILHEDFMQSAVCGLDEAKETSISLPNCCNTKNSICYVMYTSGSTGKPKGVCGTEKGLLHRLRWMETEYPYVLEDVALFKTAISFIDHLTECLGALLGNIPLVVPPAKALFQNPLSILSYLKAYRISRLTVVPSFMRTILPVLQGCGGRSIVRSMRILGLSGETLSISLWKDVHEVMPHAVILNLYGSTELSGDCMYFDCESLKRSNEFSTVTKNQIVPIGKPMPGCEASILLESPSSSISTEGELLVAGPVVALGYLNDPQGSDKKFMSKEENCENQHHHAFVFKTGDYVNILCDGNYVLIGRNDSVLKINGQRVSLEEIQHHIEEHPGVSCAVVMQIASGAFDSQLVAYVVPKRHPILQLTEVQNEQHSETGVSPTKPSERTLRAVLRFWLLERLPQVMIPQIFIPLKTLPTTISGKVDYQALRSVNVLESQVIPDLDNKQLRLKYILEVFERVLMMENISASDDFFSLGGNSITAAHVCHNLGVNMSLLFTYPSAAALEPILEKEMSKTNNKRKRLKELHLDTEKSKHQNGMDISNVLDIKLSSGDVQYNVEELQFSVDVMKVLCEVEDTWLHGLPVAIPIAVSRCNRLTLNDESDRERFSNTQRFSWTSSSSVLLSILWKFPMDSCVDSSPVLVHVRNDWCIFIGSHSHKFCCLDASSGNLKWEAILGGRVESTATVTSDFSQVVVGCYDGIIYFLSYDNGSILWKFQTAGEVKCQPTVDPQTGYIWCGSHDHNLYVLDGARRICVWKYHCRGSIFGAPAHDLAQKLSYVATTQGLVIAINLEVCMSVSWTFTCEAPIFGSLAVDRLTGYVICTLVNGDVVALTSGGEMKWKAQSKGPIFAGACLSSVLPSQVLVCSRDGWVYSFNVGDGKCFWKKYLGEPITSSVCVDEGIELVYNESTSDTLYHHAFRICCVCGTSGSVYLLKVHSKSWKGQSGECPSSASHTLSLPTKTFSDLSEGEYKLLKTTRKQLRKGDDDDDDDDYDVIATVKLPGDIFSSPVLFNGRVFVGCRDDYVYCLQLKGL